MRYRHHVLSLAVAIPRTKVERDRFVKLLRATASNQLGDRLPLRSPAMGFTWVDGRRRMAASPHDMWWKLSVFLAEAAVAYRCDDILESRCRLGEESILEITLREEIG